MKFEINIDTAKLWAMHLIAGQHDIRAYLNGVRIEASETETRMLATNGHIAGWLRRAGVTDIPNVVDEARIVEFTIPNEVIERIKPIKGMVAAATVLIDRTLSQEDTPDGERKVIDTYTLRLWDGTLIPFAVPAGNYPQMARVRPTAPHEGMAAQFNGEYFEVFAKVNKALTASKYPRQLILSHDTLATPIRVQFPGTPEFLGIMMPTKPFMPFTVDLGWAWPEPAEVDESATEQETA